MHKKAEQQAEGEGEGEGEQGPRRTESLMRGSIPGPWDHDLSQRQIPNQLSYPDAAPPP